MVIFIYYNNRVIAPAQVKKQDIRIMLKKERPVMKILKRLTNALEKVYFIYQNHIVPPVFEYDEAKSRANLAKHGIDFVTAQQLWNDENAIGGELKSVDEPRLIHIGMLSGKAYSAIYTYRGDKIRLISVRRARIKEVQKYEAHNRRGD